MSSIADLQETLTDFNSCQSSTSSSGSSDEGSVDFEEKKGFQTVNDKKREKRNKRKIALTPHKDQFLKKPKQNVSPKLSI